MWAEVGALVWKQKRITSATGSNKGMGEVFNEEVGSVTGLEARGSGYMRATGSGSEREDNGGRENGSWSWIL